MFSLSLYVASLCSHKYDWYDVQEQNRSDEVEAEVELDDNEKSESSGDDENEAERDEVSIFCVVVTQREY